MRRIGLGFLGSFLAMPAFAGLADATNALTEIKSWLFTFVGVAALVYLLYNVLMAIMERKSWGEVGMALAYCAMAGGAIVGGNWAIGLFK